MDSKWFNEAEWSGWFVDRNSAARSTKGPVISVEFEYVNRLYVLEALVNRLTFRWPDAVTVLAVAEGIAMAFGGWEGVPYTGDND